MGAIIARMMVSNDNLQDQFHKLAQEENTPRLSDILNNEFDQQKILPTYCVNRSLRTIRVE